MKRIAPALLLLACSDYDLNRPGKGGPPPADTGTVTDPDAPDIELSPSSIDFGTLPADCRSEPQEITIRNAGGADLVVSSVELSGSGKDAFELSDWSGTLAPGETATTDLVFTASAWTTYDASVVASSNDPDEPRAAVPATGRGGEDAIYEESWVQDVNETIDVLWIVDNSGSMSDAVTAIKGSFQHFIDQFVTLGLDYHLGVVTTDMDDPSQSGRLQGPVPWIDSSSADPTGDFMAAVDQGDDGSGDEQGFAAAHAALTEPLLSGANAGFLRSDAAIAIVIVTDEDDGTDDSLAWGSSSGFSSWLSSLKPDPADATFSAICGDAGLFGCIGSTGVAESGNQYIDAVDLTGGTWESICTSDFDAALQHISQTAVGIQTSFPLSEEPSNIGDMVVEDDGVEVPYDGVDGWTYDMNDNAIDFHGSAVPAAGSVVTASYPVPSECPT